MDSYGSELEVTQVWKARMVASFAPTGEDFAK